MIEKDQIQKTFKKHGGVLKTSELKDLGLTSRQINKFIKEDMISKIKYGFYELNDNITRGEVIIARLFPGAVIYLESALMYYGYTDRIPAMWQIAVDKNSEKGKYKIEYPQIKPYFIEPKFLKVGLDTIEVQGISVKIYDRDRTICDVLRYEKKLEKEVFNNSIQCYLKDRKKNIRKLFEYAHILNVKNKAHIFIGVWL